MSVITYVYSFTYSHSRKYLNISYNADNFGMHYWGGSIGLVNDLTDVTKHKTSEKTFQKARCCTTKKDNGYGQGPEPLLLIGTASLALCEGTLLVTDIFLNTFPFLSLLELLSVCRWFEALLSSCDVTVVIHIWVNPTAVFANTIFQTFTSAKPENDSI